MLNQDYDWIRLGFDLNHRWYALSIGKLPVFRNRQLECQPLSRLSSQGLFCNHLTGSTISVDILNQLRFNLRLVLNLNGTVCRIGSWYNHWHLVKISQIASNRWDVKLVKLSLTLPLAIDELVGYQITGNGSREFYGLNFGLNLAIRKI